MTQWARSYSDPPGVSEDELLLWDADTLDDNPGFHIERRQVLNPVKAWGIDGEPLDHKVGLVVWLLEEDE